MRRDAEVGTKRACGIDPGTGLDYRQTMPLEPRTSAAPEVVLVWQYGTRHARVPPEAERQLLLGYELREHLVELALEREREIIRAWASRPEVVKATAVRDHSQAVLHQLLDQAVEYRQKSHSRQLAPDLRDQIAQARQTIGTAKKGLREAKTKAYDAITPMLFQARESEREGQKAAYRTFVQERGLYWATHNRILEQHRTAERQITNQRKAGQRAQIRHRRYDGTGRLAIQLQRPASAPRRTAELLSSPQSPWANVLHLPSVCAIDLGEWANLTRSQRRQAGRNEIVVRLTGGRKPDLWTLPVQIHRPIPPAAEVVSTEVVVTRVADRRRITVHLTLRTPKKGARKGGVVAVRIGWRAMPDGSIRVAYWYGEGEPKRPLLVPEPLRDIVLVTDGDQHGEIRFPAAWSDLSSRIQAIQSGRAMDLNRLKPQVAKWLAERPKTAAQLGTTPQEVGRWRSPARMVSFARQVAGNEPNANILVSIAAWERHDRHLWQWEANERDQLLARRRDAYRAAAAMLTESWPHAVLERRLVASVNRVPLLEQTDSRRAEEARAQAHLAAPAEIAQAISQACQRRGGFVTEVDPGETTRRHHICQQPLLAVDASPTGDPIRICPVCNLTFDQDENATINMLRLRPRVTG